MTANHQDIPQPRFTGIFIPVEILTMRELSILEMFLLSWIDALYNEKHGGCFASNKYLANSLNVKENTIAKALTKLRKRNLIKDVSFDGRTRVIRAIVNELVERSQSKSGLDLNPSRVGQKSNRGWTKIHTSPYIYSKEDSKDNRPPTPNGENATALPVSANEKEKFGEDKNVLLTEKEHSALKEKFGESSLISLIEELSDYISSTGKRYKCHAATLRSWHRRKKTDNPRAKSKLSYEGEGKRKATGRRKLTVGNAS